ncbi:HEAT repeat domain-containing protein [Methylobacterium sp. sgz302541]|uniref:HEAT repeat domain-containing protein n=1 Tax=unclassified Methylobacterium TaxID=2615210 RepID=UPI003D344BA3
MANDPSILVSDLFRSAMTGLDREEEYPIEPPVGWSAISRLQAMGTAEVFNVALAACVDPNPVKRRVGAAVLGQLGHIPPADTPVLREERFRALSDLLAAERVGAADPAVLKEACYALGHLHDPRAIPALLELRTHPDARVRSSVVSGLSGYEEPEAIDSLIALSADADADVRDWATFGLGQLIASDTPALRAALHARLDDTCVDARNEAIEGLATRGDLTVLPVLIRELHQQVALPLLDAAAALAAPELCEALSAARERGLVIQVSHSPYDLLTAWTDASRACGCCGWIAEQSRQ